jgi:hypothetical protein
MAGTIIPLWAARTFDYSGLAQGAEATTVLRLVEGLLPHRDALFLFRIHTVNITGAGTLDFVLHTAAPSREDPGTAFIDSTSEVSVSVAGATAGTLLRVLLDLESFGGLGAAVQVSATATQPSGSTQTIQARVSAEVLAHK